MSAPAPASVHYCVVAADVHARLFRVTLTIAQPAALQRLSLPVWIPGSYLVREFSKHLLRLRATQHGQAVAVTQSSKNQWQVEPPDTAAALVLEYDVAAYDDSVRMAWLDADRGFFNGTSLLLRVEGQSQAPCTLELPPPTHTQDWSCATALAAEQVDARGFGTYRAADYDALADSPVEMGAFWSGSFTAGGVPHRFVVAGAAPTFDGARLLADTQAICEAAIRLWHPQGEAPPHTHYLFLLNAVHDGYGGLEHRHSTALICARRDLPRLGEAKASEGYATLLGLISHEYFHTWNVKRLRPAEFAQIDYGQENYTALLWFFEGFTSYYDDLLLRRAGRIDDAAYLKLLTRTIHQVLQAPGRQVQSVAQASFDAWIKYYRPDAHTPNTTVSYYTKGALVALCLDLTLRAEGRATLDDVMRALWQRCQGGPMTEADLRAVLLAQGGRAFDAEIDAWVHGTGDLPLAELLARHGVTLAPDTPQPAQRLGLRVQEGAAGVQIKSVLSGGLAEQAGLQAGDEWIGIELNGQGWRLTGLADLALYAGTAEQATALVARGQRLLRLPLRLRGGAAADNDTVQLSVADAVLLRRWLLSDAGNPTPV